MTREPISTLENAAFDVAVIGGGINGASAAQHLAAEGFTVLLIDRDDFGSGASSRSSRLMHFGLRYLDRGEPLWNYFANPGWFIRQCRRARDTMRHRAELVTTAPGVMKPFPMFVPVYDTGHVAPWQMAAGFRLINAIGGGEVPVDWQRIARKDWPATPFIAAARDHHRLRAMFSFIEYQYDWPERLVADYAMDARRLGAVCRNYTEVTAFRRDGDLWTLDLHDTAAPGEARVRARQIVNAAGPWIDRVLRGAGADVKQQVAATKGSHVMIRLGEAFRGQGFASFNRLGYPFYCLPWRDLHFVGPTETHFHDDPADVRVTAEEIEFLLDEANHMLPGLALTRDRVLFHWAGVRPMPHIPGYKGKQNLIPEFNDHAAAGLPNVLSVPGGPLMVHRQTGRRTAAEVRRMIAPSGAAGCPDYATRHFAEDTNSPPVNRRYPEIRLTHLQTMAREEMPVSLVDLIFRRAGLGWTDGLSCDEARRAAEAVASDLGWDNARVDREVGAYTEFVREHFLTTSGDGLVKLTHG